jgi:uncharacterized membrane protein
MKANELVTGFPGHPTHPPLTDVTIGLYSGAASFAVLSAVGFSEENTAIGWWLTLVVGLVVTVPTAGTGLLDWLKISRGTPLWRTATAHLVAMLSASVLFLLAAVAGHSGYVEQEVTTSGLVLTLAGFALLTLGGWLGGTVVFVHGMRVLNLVDEPTHRAVAPIAIAEKKRAAGGREDEKEERGGLTRY